MSKYCRICGNKRKDGEYFCPSCGTAYDYESDLLGRALRGEKSALEKIYDMTYTQGFSVAYQMMKNREDAEDVMQEAYISAFRNLEQIREPKKIKNWFNCIVANQCRAFLRKKNPILFSEIVKDDEQTEFIEWIEDEKIEFSPHEAFDYSETKRLMNDILQELPEEQRLVILMYYYEELSVGEIAQALNCSTGTVKSRLNYARKKIKADVENLERQGTKLYGIAPIPFIVWMLRNAEGTINVPQFNTQSFVSGNIAMKQTAGTMPEISAGKMINKTETTIKKAGTATTTKSMTLKIIASVTAVAVIGIGAYVGVKKHKDTNSPTKTPYISEQKTSKNETTTEEKTTLETTSEAAKVNVEKDWKSIYLNYFNKDNFPSIYVLEDLNEDGIPEICVDVDMDDSKYAFLYINKAGEVKMSKPGWIRRNDKYIASDSVFYKYNQTNGEYDIVFNGYDDYGESVFKIDGKDYSEEEYNARINKYIGIEIWDISDPDIMKGSETLLEDIKNYGDWKYIYTQYFMDEEHNYLIDENLGYGLYDVDHNGIPEIVIHTGTKESLLFWIKEGYVNEEVCGGSVGWNEDKKQLVSASGGIYERQIDIFQFDVDKGLTSIRQADFSMIGDTYEYRIDDKKVTKKEYEKLEKSLEKGCTWIGGETANLIGAIQTYKED